MFNIFKKNKQNKEKANSGQSKDSMHGADVEQAVEEIKDDIHERINKLEEIGRRRGRVYLVVGISTSFLMAMIAMYASHYILDDIIYITGKSQENIASIPEKRNKEKKAVLLNEWKECLNNSDCAETQKDCCSCNSGGNQTAINLLYLDEWQNILDNSCQDVGCLEFINCKQGEVVCENSKCKFQNIKIDVDSQAYDKDNLSNNEELIHSPDLNNQDTDKDGLFDDEEALYGCDINNPDTDGDGYLDGDEVESGYNPAGEGELLI